MCFNIERQKVAKVATKDITCFKALDTRGIGTPSNPFTYHSPMNTCEWVPQKQKSVTIVRVCNSDIRKGFHAGKIYAEAKNYGGKIYEMVIPKGSLYFENSCQFVAERMTLVSGKQLIKAPRKK